MAGNGTIAKSRFLDDSGVRTLLVATALALIAWLVYRPDRDRPPPIVDFAEFLPLLNTNADWWSRVQALTDYYAQQGRVNVLPYVLLATKWSLWEWSAPAWQVARAGLMYLVVLLTYQLLRRLRVTPMGALAGASLFLWAPAASDGWVHLTMAEPLAVVLALAASLRATRFSESRRWRLDVGLIASACTAVVLTKELLAPLVLLPVTVALCRRPDGTLDLPVRNRRNVMLVSVVGGATAAAMALVLVIHLTSPSSGYSSLYGLTPMSVLPLLAIWVTAFLPFDAIPAGPDAFWAASVLALFVLIGLGLRLALVDPDHRRGNLVLLGLSLLLPLVGVMVYVPNPWFSRFYLLPYLVGPALVLGLAFTYVEAHVLRGRGLVLGGWAVMSLYAIAGAMNLAARTDAAQRRDAGVVSVVSRVEGAGRVLFATSQPPRPEWRASEKLTGAPRGLGVTLSRFAAATHRPWPPTHDVSCREAATELARSRSDLVVINLQATCPMDFGQEAIVFRYTAIDLQRLSLVRDSAHARIFLPESGNPVQP